MRKFFENLFLFSYIAIYFWVSWRVLTYFIESVHIFLDAWKQFWKRRK